MHTIYDSWCQRSLPLDVPNKCLWSCHLSTLPHNSKWQQHEMVDTFLSTDNNHPQTQKDTLVNFSIPPLSSSVSVPSPTPMDVLFSHYLYSPLGELSVILSFTIILFYNTQYLYWYHISIGSANIPVFLWLHLEDSLQPISFSAPPPYQ